MFDPSNIESDLATLALFGGSDDGGVTRPAYTASYIEAIEWLGGRMRQSGMSIRIDDVGNLIGRVGPDGPAVVTGSHIDTVPNGGRLDGALGVLAGLECVRAICEKQVKLERAIEVIAFADEEGRFISHLGSRMMTGKLSTSNLASYTDGDDVRLTDALAEMKLGTGDLSTVARPPSDFAAYVELHIEQGPVLEAEGAMVGSVDAILGLRRERYEFLGSANHSGATPQAHRQDALLAASDFMSAAEASMFPDRSADATERLTFGELRVDPGVDCVIPGRVRLTCEVRDRTDDAIRDRLLRLRRIAVDAAKPRGVRVRVREYDNVSPARLSDKVGRLTETACRDRGIPHRPITSGAAHDAQSFADLTEAGMIFVPSAGGRSHCPEEDTSSSAIASGASVLFDVISLLASDPVVLSDGGALSRAG